MFIFLTLDSQSRYTNTHRILVFLTFYIFQNFLLFSATADFNFSILSVIIFTTSPRALFHLYGLFSQWIKGSCCGKYKEIFWMGSIYCRLEVSTFCCVNLNRFFFLHTLWLFVLKTQYKTNGLYVFVFIFLSHNILYCKII